MDLNAQTLIEAEQMALVLQLLHLLTSFLLRWRMELREFCCRARLHWINVYAGLAIADEYEVACIPPYVARVTQAFLVTEIFGCYSHHEVARARIKSFISAHLICICVHDGVFSLY